MEKVQKPSNSVRSLYIYCLCIGLSKVKDSHRLRDLDSVLTTPASFSSLQRKSVHHSIILFIDFRSTYLLKKGQVNFASSFLIILTGERQYQSQMFDDKTTYVTIVALSLILCLKRCIYLLHIHTLITFLHLNVLSKKTIKKQKQKT
jgi:hypothetical protein